MTRAGVPTTGERSELRRISGAQASRLCRDLGAGAIHLPRACEVESGFPKKACLFGATVPMPVPAAPVSPIS